MACQLDKRNKRVLLCSIMSNVVLLIGVVILSILAIKESTDNYCKYNKTELTATKYITQQLDCYGLPWRAFIVTEYDAVNRNATVKHYKQVFRRIGDNEICGINEPDVLKNASKIWPLNDHKDSYYLIDDPTVLISSVTHGELYMIFAILGISGTIFITIFTAMYLWSRRIVKYTKLQMPAFQDV